MEQLIEKLKKVITETDRIPFVWYDRSLRLFLCSGTNRIRVLGDPTVTGTPLWSEYQCNNLILAIKKFLIIKTPHNQQVEDIYQLIQKFKPIFEYRDTLEIWIWPTYFKLKLDKDNTVSQEYNTLRVRIKEFIKEWGYSKTVNVLIKEYKRLPKKLKKLQKKQDKQLKADKKATKNIAKILKLEPAVVRFCQFCGKPTKECEC